MVISRVADSGCMSPHCPNHRNSKQDFAANCFVVKAVSLNWEFLFLCVCLPPSLYVCLFSSLCVQLYSASLNHMLFETRKWLASLSLAALAGCGRVIVIATEQGIKAEAAPGLRRAASFQMIPQRHTHEKQFDSSTGMSELCLCG